MSWRAALPLRRLLARGGGPARANATVERRHEQLAALDVPPSLLEGRTDVLGPLFRTLEGWQLPAIEGTLAKLSGEGGSAAAPSAKPPAAPPRASSPPARPPVRPPAPIAASPGPNPSRARPRPAAVGEEARSRIAALLAASAAAGAEPHAGVAPGDTREGARGRAAQAATRPSVPDRTPDAERKPVPRISMARSGGAAAADRLPTSGGPSIQARGAISVEEARGQLQARVARAGGLAWWNAPLAAGPVDCALPLAAWSSPSDGADLSPAPGDQTPPGAAAPAQALASVLDRVSRRVPQRASVTGPTVFSAGGGDPERAAVEPSGLRRLLALAPRITGERATAPRAAANEAQARRLWDRDRASTAPLAAERTLPSLLAERMQDDRLAERLERILRAEARREGVDLDGVAS